MTQASIEDRFAINDLFVRYTGAIDMGDVDTLVNCFTEDGSLHSPAVGAYVGREAIRAFAERFAAFRRNGSQFRHVISNLTLQVDADQATARCYLLVFLTKDGKSRMLPPGQYACELRKQDGVWRFQKRVVIHDHEYTLDGL
jgi:uncharacterized protein (TIGR02246 family)